MTARVQSHPPVGYRDWHEAAQDADADGCITALDIREMPIRIQVPPEYLAHRQQTLPAAPKPLRLVKGGA